MAQFVITYIILTLLVALAVAKIRRLWWALDRVEELTVQKLPISDPQPEVRFTIFVPLLNNFEHIPFIQTWMRRLGRAETTSVVFVISGKSAHLDRLPQRQDAERGAGRFIIVPPEHSANKAAQINYAVRELNISDPRHYIVIYDADSRPDRNTFRAALGVITESNFPLVLQQPSIYQSAGTIWQQMEGLFQSLWTFHYEIYYLMRNLSRPNHFTYTVSHGLFLRSDFFMHNPFTEKRVEDLCYGYRLSLRGVYPHVIPAFDHAATPRTISQWVSQKRRWYQGSLYALLSARVFRHPSPMVWWVRRLLWDVEWGSINIVVILFSFSNFSVGPALLILLFWIILYNALPALVLTVKTQRRHLLDHHFPLQKILLLSVVYFLLYNLGPVLGLVTYRPSKA